MEFNFSFSIGEATDIKVIHTSATGVQTVLVNPTHYSVTGTPIGWDGAGNANEWSYDNGGKITTVATYASGVSLTITTDIPLTQEEDFYSGMANLPGASERCLDKLTRIAKEQEARIAILELSVLLGGTVIPSQITYLGRLASDPSTTGWGTSEAFTLWYNTTDNRAKYWNGTEILMF